MKKYFLVLSVAAAALMASCGPEPVPPPPPGPGGELKLNIEDATYYGEEIAAGVGYFSLNFTADGSNDKLRLDLFGKVADPTSKPKLTAGTYELGSVETPEEKKYFVATSGTDEMGTIFWKNGSPVLITGGTFNIQSSAGGYTIKVKLKAGDEIIEAKYSGTFTIEDARVDPPRTDVTGGIYRFEYSGEYAFSKEKLGKFVMLIQDKDDSDRVLQIIMTIPFPTEGDYPPDFVPIPVGTFEVSNEPQEAYKIISSTVEEAYSAEVNYKSGNPSFGVLIEGGSLTIAKEGETYTVTTDLKGTKFTYSNGQIAPGSPVDEVIWNLTGEFPEYAFDMTNPFTTITENMDLTNLTKIFYDPWGLGGTSSNPDKLLWRIILHEEDLVFDPNNPDYNKNGTLFIGGTGKCLAIQIFTAGNAKKPIGKFDMMTAYDVQDPPTGQTMPTSLLLNSGGYDPLSLGIGTVYLQVGRDNEGLAIVDEQGGIVKSKGYIEITEEVPGKMKLVVNVFDKLDNNFTGTFEFDSIGGEKESASLTSVKQMQLSAANLPSLRPYSLGASGLFLNNF